MVRRVVTGHRDGKAVFVGDGVPGRTHVFKDYTGLEWSFAWATPAEPLIAAHGEAEAVSDATSVVPAPGETRLQFLTVPPDSWLAGEDFDPAAAMAEFAAHQPDLAVRFEPDAPGFHRTDSIDYVIVLDGEVWLELDGGQETHLRKHDVVVQVGTRHAWRNKSDRTATLAVFLVGAEREAQGG